MCTGAEIMIGASLLSSAGGMQGAAAQQKADYEQAALNEIDARAEIEAAKVGAERIRRFRNGAQGSAKAALAASGVDVNSQTAEMINQDIAQRGNEDIYNTLMTGQSRATRLRTEGSQAKDQGNAAVTAAAVNTGSSLLSTYSQVKGWK